MGNYIIYFRYFELNKKLRNEFRTPLRIMLIIIQVRGGVSFTMCFIMHLFSSMYVTEKLYCYNDMKRSTKGTSISKALNMRFLGLHVAIMVVIIFTMFC